MKKIFFITFIFLTIGKMLYAQDDYIVKLDGDTLKGKLRESSIFGIETIKIKTNDEKSFVKVNGGQIREYYKGKTKSTFVRKALPNTTDTVYLRILERGKVDFYSYFRTSGQFSYLDYYASKENSSLLKVKTNQVFTSSRGEKQQNLFSLINDRPDLIESFKSLNDYGFQSIQKLIKTYNDSFK